MLISWRLQCLSILSVTIILISLVDARTRRRGDGALNRPQAQQPDEYDPNYDDAYEYETNYEESKSKDK